MVTLYVCTHFITVLYLYIFHFLIKQLQSILNSIFEICTVLLTTVIL
jgi:hypothetical protein